MKISFEGMALPSNLCFTKIPFLILNFYSFSRRVFKAYLLIYQSCVDFKDENFAAMNNITYLGVVYTKA